LSSVLKRPRLFLASIVIAALTILAPYLLPDLLEFTPPSDWEWGYAVLIFFVAQLLLEFGVRRKNPLEGIWLLAQR
jgi:hypothetical protein